jgi:hypothetical protein
MILINISAVIVQYQLPLQHQLISRTIMSFYYLKNGEF